MTYYIIKSPNMTLVDTYKLLHLKEHHQTYELAQAKILTACRDVIPEGSEVLCVNEDIQEVDSDLDIKITINRMK